MYITHTPLRLHSAYLHAGSETRPRQETKLRPYRGQANAYDQKHKVVAILSEREACDQTYILALALLA